MAEELSSNKLDAFEPGAARYGNFINYYSFNSTSKRLDVLPPDLLLQKYLGKNGIVCLDIGCNSGELTLGLYSRLASPFEDKTCLHMLGIDLDETLITRSNLANNFKDSVMFKRLDIMEESSTSELQEFLQKHNKTQFDLISCFSTTMWIHLNHGDEGLEKFLKTISGMTEYLLLEPQEWKCYKSAVRRMTRLNRDSFQIKDLKIKDITNHIETYLKFKCDIELDICFGETSWGRKLYLFKKTQTPKIGENLEINS